MLDAVLALVPSARVGYIGLQRDERTAVASQYYSKLPDRLDSAYVLMIDPMLATGGSASAALELLRARRRPPRSHRLHRRRAGRRGRRRARSPRRRHLYPGRRQPSQRAEIHRPRPRRLRRPAVRNALRRAHDSRRSLANGADIDRAQQDPRPRLSAGRDDGTAHVRRGGLSAVDGRTAVAGDWKDVRRDPRVVAGSRRHAAFDAGRAQRGDDGRAAEGLRGGRRSRVRAAARRRHRVVHAISRLGPRADPRRASRCSRRPRRSSKSASGPTRSRRASAIASTAAIRERRGCSRWRSSSSSKASMSGCSA